MVRFAAMDRIIDYGKIILIGVFVLAGILLNNFYNPDRYEFKPAGIGGNDRVSIIRYDKLDGSVESCAGGRDAYDWIKIHNLITN